MHTYTPHVLSISLLLAAAGCGADHKDDTDGSESHATHDASATAASTGDDPSSSTTMATGGAASEPPAAPTALMASLLDGGVHLVWNDVATNEDNYMLERRMMEVAEFATVSELPFDSVTYHDIDVSPGMTYVYRVKAINTAGESLSNEATIPIP